jgi:CelD/BcsL family acetyltransferase involved in cellulose biosynthesis
MRGSSRMSIRSISSNAAARSQPAVGTPGVAQRQASEPDGSMGHRLVAHLSPLHPSDSVPDWWTPLFQQASGASIFLSREWLQSWIDIYAAEFDGAWVCWKDGGEIVGGCLILRRTVWWRFIPQATVFINVAAETRSLSPWSEFNHALYVAGYEEAIAASLAQTLAKLPWARLEFWGFEDNVFSRSLLQKLPNNMRQTRAQPSHYLDFESFRGQEYEATLSSSTRSQIRRSRRLYEQAFGTLEIEFARSCDEALAFLEQMGALHNAVWRSRVKEASFESQDFISFHRLVVKRLWARQAVDLFRVRAKDRVIGLLFTFKHGRKVYCYQSGFAQETDKRLKPGLLTHARAIIEYGRLGFQEYDLLAGDARYKRSLTNSYRTLYWNTTYRNSLCGRSLWLARRLKARLRRNTKAERSNSAAGAEEP